MLWIEYNFQSIDNYTWLKFNVFLENSLYLFILYIFLQRDHGNNILSCFDILVCIISIKTLCYSLFNGPSTSTRCLPLCSIVWCICVDYNFLIIIKQKSENLRYCRMEKNQNIFKLYSDSVLINLWAKIFDWFFRNE